MRFRACDVGDMKALLETRYRERGATRRCEAGFETRTRNHLTQDVVTVVYY